MNEDSNIEQSLEAEVSVCSVSERPCLYIREEGTSDTPCYGSVSSFYVGEIPSYDPETEKIILDGESLIVESRLDDILAKNKEELRSAFKEMIYSNYSSENQKNIDREALSLKAIQAIDETRLTDEEKEKINAHNNMNEWINQQRILYKEIKNALEGMPLEDLISFDVKAINENQKELP